MIGGVHSSVDDPPNTSMFARAGGGSVRRKKTDSGQSLADFVKQLSCALSPPSNPSNGSRTPSATSPAKSIESRSKCYKQLSDLNNLKITGVLSDFFNTLPAAGHFRGPIITHAKRGGALKSPGILIECLFTVCEISQPTCAIYIH